ncbi:hypothetical protein DESPIGER_1447 [Desulfovibrio piger]|uniref:Uncharacterized protein n=1 Tax=Desulfovibrio piger TaxID=901 RepID=A0A1K1LEX4_9BACT|nr:hypothetical protein DESPIGER_1447 [Desulfovibrio piger]
MAPARTQGRERKAGRGKRPRRAPQNEGKAAVTAFPCGAS